MISKQFAYYLNKLERTVFLLYKRATLTINQLTQANDQEHLTIFVAGVQRSGTNLIMNVFERSLDTQVFHESDSRAFDTFLMKPPEVILGLVRSSPARFVVVKALCELDKLRWLLDNFSPARAVWMVRDFDDMVNSHLALWSGCSEIMDDIVHCSGEETWRSRGMSEETRNVISRLFRRGVNDATAVGLFWYMRNKLFFEQGFHTDPRVRPVRYESLVTNPDDEFRRVFEFVGLNPPKHAVKSVFSSSISKSPPPPIDPEVRALCADLFLRFVPLFVPAAPELPMARDQARCLD